MNKEKKEKKVDLKKTFLQEFIKKIILNYASKIIDESPNKDNYSSENQINENRFTISKKNINSELTTLKTNQPTRNINIQPILPKIEQPIITQQQRITNINTQPILPKIEQPIITQQQRITLQKSNINIHKQNPLEKITYILKNPTVKSIECTGPNKKIIINNQGRIQIAPFKLEKEEINYIIKEISKYTRIPITQGVFKAIYKNLIITAIISEFVGTRFILEKNNSHQRVSIH